MVRGRRAPPSCVQPLGLRNPNTVPLAPNPTTGLAPSFNSVLHCVGVGKMNSRSMLVAFVRSGIGHANPLGDTVEFDATYHSNAY